MKTEARSIFEEMIKEDIIQNIDGYYVYWPKKINGYLDEYGLKVIYDILHEMNKPWDDEINKFFDEQQGWQNGDVDCMSGAFRQDEIDNATAWR